jgi:hypothetical protein
MQKSSMLPWGKAGITILILTAKLQLGLWNYLFCVQSLGIWDDWRGIIRPICKSFVLERISIL